MEVHGGCLLLLLALVLASSSGTFATYVEALAASFKGKSGHFEPQIAMSCGSINQYLDKNGHWQSDKDIKSTCVTEKLDILHYCRKAYPHLEITNVVESAERVKITNWCHAQRKKCKWTHYVKPYRCIVGAFQSDALLVPEKCVFDHIHNINDDACLSYATWNTTSADSCTKRGMKLRSFAMLVPCGIDIFSGVEFVCCPIGFEEEDDDTADAADGVVARKHKSSVSSRKSTARVVKPTDKYFFKTDREHEHEAFKSAERRVEQNHREKITKVMKQWSEAEEHYQELKLKDPRGADKYKSEMTVRFKKTIAALEDEDKREKQQIVGVHQQRVEANINEKKRVALDNFMRELHRDIPKPHMVLKAIERFIRMEEKDREHRLNYFAHLITRSPDSDETRRQKTSLLEHLDEIETRINQSVAMLSRVPDVKRKILTSVEAFLAQFHHRNKEAALQVAGKVSSKSTETDEDVEDEEEDDEETDTDEVEIARSKLLAEYRKDVEKKQKEKAKVHSKAKAVNDKKVYPPFGSTSEDSSSQSNDEADDDDDDQSDDDDYDEENYDDDYDDEEYDEDDYDEDEEGADEEEKGSSTAAPKVEAPPASPRKTVAVFGRKKVQAEDLAGRKGGKALKYDSETWEDEHTGPALHSHRNVASYEQKYILKEEYESDGMQEMHVKHKGLYMVVTLGTVALLTVVVVAIVVVARRRSAQRRGLGHYVEVDTSTSPEERHVANMQSNGYENPTYKYFESTQ